MKQRGRGMGLKRVRGYERVGSVWVGVEAELLRGRLRFRPLAETEPALAERDVKSAQVVGFPVKDCFCRWLDAPLANPGKAMRVLPTLLDIVLPFTLESCVYVFAQTRTGADGNLSALGVGARKTGLEALLSQWRVVGMDPEVCVHEGLALWGQALRESLVDTTPGAGTVLVHVGAGGATLVLGLGGAFVNAHAVGKEDPSEWGRLIKAGLGGTECVRRWLWSGGGAELESLRGAVAARGIGESRLVEDPVTFLARALAAEVLVGDGVARNLRRGELAHAAWQRRLLGRGRGWAWTLLAAGLLLAGVAVAVTGRARQQVGQLEAEAMALASRLSGGASAQARGMDAVLIARRLVEAEIAAMQPLTAFRRPSLMPAVAAVLTRCQNLGIQLVMLELEDGRIAMLGSLPGWQQGETLKAGLEAEGYAVTMERGDAREDGWIPFSLRSPEVQP